MTTTPLTLQHAIDNKFSYIDCVKHFKPEWTDEQCDHYLWETTAFPLNGAEELIIQLNYNFLKK